MRYAASGTLIAALEVVLSDVEQGCFTRRL
jgi:hypothetical protein